MSDKFIKALPIYPEHLLKEMNVSLFFVCEINSENKSILKITGNSVYRVFDNGELLEYAQFVGNYYGTPQFYVEQLLDEGYTVKIAIPMDNYIEYIVEK